MTADRVPAVRCADVLAALQGAEGPVAALYSGDTGFYSGADGLVELLRRQGIPFRVLPGLSSVQLLAARLGRPWQDWRLVSAHGVPCDPVQAVCGGRPVLFLTGTGEGSPRALCARLAAAGLAGLPVTVGENLACPGEKITQGTAGQLAETAFGPLAVLLAEAAPRAPRRAPGWPDEAFARADGIPMTKQAVRAQILAGLAVTPGDTAWDVGAGTGSVSIELAFANGGAPVYAVECLPEGLRPHPGQLPVPWSLERPGGGGHGPRSAGTAARPGPGLCGGAAGVVLRPSWTGPSRQTLRSGCASRPSPWRPWPPP